MEKSDFNKNYILENDIVKLRPLTLDDFEILKDEWFENVKENLLNNIKR